MNSIVNEAIKKTFFVKDPCLFFFWHFISPLEVQLCLVIRRVLPVSGGRFCNVFVPLFLEATTQFVIVRSFVRFFRTMKVDVYEGKNTGKNVNDV